MTYVIFTGVRVKWLAVISFFTFYSVDLKCFILLISVFVAQMKGVKESIPYFTLKIPQGKQYLQCPLKCFQHANNGGHTAGVPSLFPF